MIDYTLKAAKARQAALRDASGYKPPAKEKVESYSTYVKRLEKEQRAALRARRENLWPIAYRIMGAVGDCIPDGDPIDLLAPFVRRQMRLDEYDAVTPWLDKACRKHLHCSSYNRYLIDAWDGWNEVCEPDQRMDNPWRPQRRTK